MNKSKIILQEYTVPYGTLVLGSYEDKLCLCDWKNNLHPERNLRRVKRFMATDYCYGDSRVIEITKSQIREYLDNGRTTFDIPLLMCGTPFQKIVWEHINSIPFGETITYGELANNSGCPSSVRAVANAVGANPVSIIVPCHRIIGSNSSPGGYAGGLTAKFGLLALENSLPNLFTYYDNERE